MFLALSYDVWKMNSQFCNMMEGISTCYISSGCNRTPQSADWGYNGLICYGTCRSVAICQPQDLDGKPAKVLCTLNKHRERVNCVKWMKTCSKLDAETCFVSGSVDGTAIVWQQDNDKQYKAVATLQGHTGPVNSVAAISVSDGGNPEKFTSYIVTASADSQVKIWRKATNEDYSLMQNISFGTGFALDVALHMTDTNFPVLACGSEDHKVHLYVLQNQEFTKVMVLQGHEDWIRAISFASDDNGDILLASAGQDFFIRIWRISRREAGQEITKSVNELSIGEEIKMRENMFSFTGKDGSSQAFAVSLESVLSGHENWIYSVRWHPPQKTDNGIHQPMSLLSASMDKTMILWKPDPDSGVWVDEVRVGEVGGNTLGFYGGLFSPHGNSIMAHGYQGAFHQWSKDKTSDVWSPVVTVSGHFDAVQDLSWDPSGGEFVVSVSSDQTCRLHGPWVRDEQTPYWFEIARPQVHGYDLQCLAMINRYKMASGADEKVARTFEAPKNFIENFCSICGQDLGSEMQKEEAKNRPEGASVPALGLSNKAVFSDQAKPLPDEGEIQAHPNDQYPEIYFEAMSLKKPPSEEQLLQNTLWPETQKLYGHGYEIFSIATDPKGTILATTCKASKAEFAGIILWDTSSWTQICQLDGPTLTVTQMVFSHNGCCLLAVSRDRTWTMFKRKDENQPPSDALFSRMTGTDKRSSAHSRIIWSCAWSHDDKYFFTASRDKKVMFWRFEDLQKTEGATAAKPVQVIDVSDSATAVDVAPVFLSDDRYLVAVGLESGNIIMYTWQANKGDNSLKTVYTLDQSLSHNLSVSRLRFRPVLGCAGDKSDKSNDNYLQLASSSADHGVRIYDIDLTVT